MTASQHYSPQQIAAWAQIDESRWKEKLAKSQVRVAVINAQPVGFITCVERYIGNDSNLLIVFYVQIMPDDFVMQLHRF